MAQVVHGGENDILWLQRDYRIYIANLFDTEKAAAVRCLSLLIYLPSTACLV